MPADAISAGHARTEAHPRPECAGVRRARRGPVSPRGRSCCFLIGGRVFTGDCLFVGDCGRVDLPGSDIEQMYDSLFNKVRKLDDALVVCPGHHYGPTPTSTIAHEKTTNYTLQPRSVEEFKAFMRAP